MMDYIKGRLASISDETIVVENGGIGYELRVPSNSSFFMSREGQEVKVYTFLAISEDKLDFYGFEDRPTKDLFKQLITVSGVGKKGAISILSVLPVGELKKAIAYEDVSQLTMAKGIGKKTAQKIILELKDKVNVPVKHVLGTEVGDEAIIKTEVQEALEGMVQLGFTKVEASECIEKIGDIEGMSSSEIIKKALVER